MSNRYTAKVAESLKLRGWIDEIQAKALHADNARLKGEVEKWRLLSVKEAIAADNAKSDLQRHKSCLEVARGALLDEREEIIRGGRHHVEERRMGVIDHALHQINEVLGGDSTKTT